jgi:CHAT domain-containing protein
VLAGANRSAAAIVTAEALAQAPPFADLELAVLSACDTGLGTSWRGEGILGLQSALFARGAHNVLVSLWTIADEATALLMAEFYATLAAGAPATVALQRAARSLKARYPQPYFWAPFVIVAGGA